MRHINELTNTDILTIKSRLKKGHQVQKIARDLDINMGRISEIKTGKRAVHINPNQGSLGI